MGIVDQVKGFIPDLTFGGGLVKIISILAILFLIGILAIVVAYLAIMHFKYKYKILIYENLAGRGYVQTGRDKAILVNMGDEGEQILRLKTKKLFRPAYGKRVGKNTYLFVVAGNGFWYNSVYGDFDKRLKELTLEPIDKEVRYAFAGIRKGIKDAYGKKENPLIKYLPYIGFFLLMIIFGIAMWFSTRNYVEGMSAANQAMQAAKEVMEAAQRVIGNLDNVISGSGARSVG